MPLTKAKISTTPPKKDTAANMGKYCMIKPASMMQISNMIACMVLYRIKWGHFRVPHDGQEQTKKCEKRNEPVGVENNHRRRKKVQKLKGQREKLEPVVGEGDATHHWDQIRKNSQQSVPGRRTRVRPLFHPGPPNKVSIKVAGFPSSSPSTAPVPSYCDGSNESGMFAARVRKRPPCVITIAKNKRGQYYFSQTKVESR